MDKSTTNTQKLAQTDSAIEIMGAMRATRISRLAKEKAKPKSERDNKLIDRLDKELDLLREERHLMYKGDENVKNKILTEYSKDMKDFLVGKKHDR